ncbi:hypothetical protein PIB30_104308 [Stylosanthes scabra]|uniref:Uncharacterized protein n=1 Tax=Stylosanthes scabra TaxID=79078 RepID=A0ABU6RY33_9FABA|nr:hypothetical protein [Stylosanthes scabra]
MWGVQNAIRVTYMVSGSWLCMGDKAVRRQKYASFDLIYQPWFFFHPLPSLLIRLFTLKAMSLSYFLCWLFLSEVFYIHIYSVIKVFFIVFCYLWLLCLLLCTLT